MSASCVQHPEVDAVVTCERCGAFMCETCTRYGTETRCKACRPRRTKTELKERRANAVKRAPRVRCLKCGAEGVRHDEIQPFRLRELLNVPVAAMLCGLPLLFSLLNINQGQPRCVACGTEEDLVPGREGVESEGYEHHLAMALERSAHQLKLNKRWMWVAFGVLVPTGLLLWLGSRR